MPPVITWDDLLRPGLAADFFAREAWPAFDADAGEYSPANAWWLAELSRLVYRHDAEENPAAPQPSRAAFLHRAGFRQVAFFRGASSATQALLIQRDSPVPFAVLVFRGTEQKLQDFLHDADTWPVPAFGGAARVHRGFERALNAVWPEVSAALRSLRCPVFYTGHSLGAALATLAAARHAPRAVYTFGSPRVGDDGFAERLGAVRVYRIVHEDDIVATVPPEWLGFRHVGEERRIGRPAVEGASFDLRSLLAQLGPLIDALQIQATTPIKPLADHAPINYVRYL